MTKILSLNVGKPRTAVYGDREVVTGIFKSPVPGPLLLRRLNLDGDCQADLSVHGGRNKAVYAYPSEHYAFWREQFPEQELPWGMFGENFTTEGLLEESAYIGDQFRIGGAIVKVTQPRMPCFKLGIRFGRPDMVKRFLASRRSGIYFSVIEEGMVNVSDAIERIEQNENCVSIADVNRAYTDTKHNLPLVRRIVELEILPSGLHEEFAEELALLEQ
ncbi:MAG TPA: MOSC domain-containing protein [Candidatus Acidoferrales bacterium]|jgi:MOSC domain-containing protein YiiM|nr:MOSC domain-containing protein [Candidatus Acidoferrales bacterium]